jgi:23S rRNA pseudouridine1911/1915/1917 synthase
VICDKKSHPLKVNDVVTIHKISENTASDTHPRGENIPIKIIFEDDFLAVIDKPSGMTVHPAPGHHSGTLVNALLYHFGKNLSLLDSSSPTHKPRPGIVHRLDKDTSGVMLIAKNDKVHYLLSQLFMLRQIEKTYQCICVGVPKTTTGDIVSYIGRHARDRKKMAIRPVGKQAITTYKLVHDFEYFSQIEVSILTGRTHQIRVHLESINHPVLGDDTYSSLKRTLSACPLNLQKRLKVHLSNHLSRQALHAQKICFVHPISLEKVTFESEMPEDMMQTAAFLKGLVS